jgi:hypothetical protein
LKLSVVVVVAVTTSLVHRADQAEVVAVHR